MKVKLKKHKKSPAPFIIEQVRSRTNAEIIHKCKSGFLAEFCGDVNPIRPKLLSEKLDDKNARNW